MARVIFWRLASLISRCEMVSRFGDNFKMTLHQRPILTCGLPSGCGGHLQFTNWRRQYSGFPSAASARRTGRWKRWSPGHVGSALLRGGANRRTSASALIQGGLSPSPSASGLQRWPNVSGGSSLDRRSRLSQVEPELLLFCLLGRGCAAPQPVEPTLCQRPAFQCRNCSVERC